MRLTRLGWPIRSVAKLHQIDSYASCTTKERAILGIQLISVTNKFIGLLLLLCFASVVSAQSSAIDGDWQGTLEGTGLTMLFHVKLHGQSTVDSPSQHRYGLLTDATIEGKTVTITMLSAGMSFEGTLQDSQIKGTYTQTGSSYPLTLTRIGRSKPSTSGSNTSKTKTSRISGASLDGNWEGVVEQVNYPLVFHIKLNGKSTTDSPRDHVLGYLVSVSLEGDNVRIAMPSAGMELKGTLQGSVIKGTYSQLGSSWPITLRKMSTDAKTSALTPQIRAGDVDGDWEGVVEQVNYPMVFHIKLNGKSTSDSPRDHVYGYLIGVKVEGPTVRIEMPSVSMKFEGTLQGSQLKGTYSQLGSKWPLTLTRSKMPNNAGK